MIWTTKDGTEIPIKDLTNSHLLNVKRLLHRIPVKEQYLSALGEIYQVGCLVQGEMALDSIDSAANELDYNLEQFVEMRNAIDEEVERRKL